MFFSSFHKSSSRFSFFFLWLWTFLILYSMFAFSFFIAFSLSLQKSLSFFYHWSRWFNAYTMKKKPMGQSPFFFIKVMVFLIWDEHMTSRRKKKNQKNVRSLSFFQITKVYKSFRKRALCKQKNTLEQNRLIIIKKISKLMSVEFFT